mmetsp:Transcript_21039/g.40034  ORF Transcript_21039/g.40034 Transcript_21039/m.40034 type:complete len:266 (+) Transcript_21039:1882-2679(+)
MQSSISSEMAAFVASHALDLPSRVCCSSTGFSGFTTTFQGREFFMWIASSVAQIASDKFLLLHVSVSLEGMDSRTASSLYMGAASSRGTSGSPALSAVASSSEISNEPSAFCSRIKFHTWAICHSGPFTPCSMNLNMSRYHMNVLPGGQIHGALLARPMSLRSSPRCISSRACRHASTSAVPSMRGTPYLVLSISVLSGHASSALTCIICSGKLSCSLSSWNPISCWMPAKSRGGVSLNTTLRNSAYALCAAVGGGSSSSSSLSS